MKQILKALLRDCCTHDTFYFSLQCSQCGKIWYSTPIPFSKAGVEPPTEGKRIIYRALYQKEKECARDLAIKQGEEGFSICPICRRLICDDCFMVCEDLDLCCACAARLNEEGNPVGTGADTAGCTGCRRPSVPLQRADGCFRREG